MGVLLVVAFVEVACDHLQDVGRGDHAFERAVFIDDESHVDKGPLQNLQRLQHRGGLRNEGRRGDMRLDRQLSGGQQGVQKVLLVHHAHRVVEIAVPGHHDARIGTQANLLAQRLGLIVQRHPIHIRARRHGDTHRAVAETQDLLDHLLLFRLDQTGRRALGDHGLDLFLGHVRAIAILDAKHLEDARRRGGQKQHEGLEHDRQGRDRGRHLGRDRFGKDQRQTLGHQFADDQRHIGDADDHQGGGEHLRIGRQRRKAGFQKPIQLARDRRLPVSARQNADQGDADLDGRQEVGRFLRQLQGRPRPPIAPLRPALQPGLAGRHDRQLGHGEQAVEHHEEQNDDNGDE